MSEQEAARIILWMIVMVVLVFAAWVVFLDWWDARRRKKTLDRIIAQDRGLGTHVPPDAAVVQSVMQSVESQPHAPSEYVKARAYMMSDEAAGELEIFHSPDEMVLLAGSWDELPDEHSCSRMGCGKAHVVMRLRLLDRARVGAE